MATIMTPAEFDQLIALALDGTHKRAILEPFIERAKPFCTREIPGKDRDTMDVVTHFTRALMDGDAKYAESCVKYMEARIRHDAIPTLAFD